MLDTYQYLALMAGCLVVTLPLQVFLRAHVYDRPVALAWSVVPVVVVFTVWDIAGIIRGHWTYNPRFVSGITLGLGFPLEELVFFIVVPICGLLTYGAVGSMLKRFASRGHPETPPRSAAREAAMPVRTRTEGSPPAPTDRGGRADA